MDINEGSSTYDAERQFLRDCIVTCPGQYVIEVGAYRGATTVHLAECARQVGKHVYVVDPWAGKYGADEQVYNAFQKATAWWFDVITVVRTTSQLAVLPGALLNTCVAFVDADHAGEAPYNDMVKFWPYVAHGGVLAIHDYFDRVHGPGVSACVDRFAASLPAPQTLHLLKYFPTPEERRQHRTKRSGITGLAWIRKGTVAHA